MVTVDGERVDPQGYNINGYNFYKLRDIAYILNGTDSQFNVTWDGANNRIVLTDDAAYQEVGGEMTSSVSAEIKNVSESDSTIVLDGKTLSLTGYRINGNNYYKIRDVGSVLGFSVDFNPETEIVLIGSAIPDRTTRRTTPMTKPRSPTRQAIRSTVPAGATAWV